MSDNIGNENSAAPEEEELFELSPQEATDLGGKPSVINRKRILIVISVFFAVFVCGGLLINTVKKNNKKTSDDKELYSAGSSQSDFLDSLQNRALRNRSGDASSASEISAIENESESLTPLDPKAESKTLQNSKEDSSLPKASFNVRDVDPSRQQQQVPPPPSSSGPQPYSQQQGSGSSQNAQQQLTHFKSPLVPMVEGRLFAQQSLPAQTASGNSSSSARSPAEEYFAAAAAAGRNSANPYAPSDYDAQNGQQNKSSFYGSSNNGGQDGGVGFFISDNSLWTGTVIPAVLETAVNTDLPGNILARVTQNIYDSKTGLSLLVPQGTLLLARYNSSISYAQHRVQIVWDSMIRPDGFQIDFGGANAVDKQGMSGSAAKYQENWFEYLKAAGIITLFSVANAKMAETAAQYAPEETAGAIAASNSAFVNQIGGNFITRAMNIQPTLTIDNGSQVSVMLNRTLFLPPVPNYPPTKKYILE